MNSANGSHYQPRDATGAVLDIVAAANMKTGTGGSIRAAAGIGAIMAHDELIRLSAREAVRLLRAGEVRPAELVDAAAALEAVLKLRPRTPIDPRSPAGAAILSAGT